MNPRQPRGQGTTPQSPAALKAALAEGKKTAEADKKKLAELDAPYPPTATMPSSEVADTATKVLVNGVEYVRTATLTQGLDTTAEDQFTREELITELLAATSAFLNRESDEADAKVQNFLCGLGLNLTKAQRMTITEVVTSGVNQPDADPSSGYTEAQE